MRFGRIAIALIAASILLIHAVPSDAARWGKKEKIALDKWVIAKSTDDHNGYRTDAITIILIVRNQTDATIEAWRANCVVNDPFDKKLFSFVANGDTRSIEPRGVSVYAFTFGIFDGEYTIMTKYNLDLLRLELKNIEVAK